MWEKFYTSINTINKDKYKYNQNRINKNTKIFLIFIYLITNLINIIKTNNINIKKININKKSLHRILNKKTKTKQNKFPLPLPLSLSLYNNTKSNQNNKKILKNFFLKLSTKCQNYIPCNIFLLKIENYLLKHTNTSIFIENVINNKPCSQRTLNITKENIYEIIDDSASRFMDYGLEADCRRANFSYYLINFNIDDYNYFHNPKTNDKNKFLKLQNFTMGLCYLKNCEDFLFNFSNKNLNKKFHSYMKNNKISNITIEKPKIYSEFSENFIIFLWINLPYMLIKLISGISYSYYLNKKNKLEKNLEKNIKKIYKENLSDSDEEFDIDFPNSNFSSNNFSYEESSSNNSYSKTDFLFAGNFQIKNLPAEKSKSILSLENNKSLTNTLLDHTNTLTYENGNSLISKSEKILKFFSDYFSFVINFKQLIKTYSIYYNEEKIMQINTLKFLVLFLQTYNHVLYTILILPRRDYNVENNFQSFLFCLFKLSTYSYDIFLCLEALTTAYKLMNFIKKNGHNFCVFLKFWCFCIPKILIFLLIYFIYQIGFENFGKILKPNYNFESFLRKRFNKKLCYCQDNFIIFNFFEFLFSEKFVSSYDKCFKFTYFYVNMFLSFNLFLVIVYLSMKIRHKLFDFFITFCFIFSALSSFYFYNNHTNNKTTFDYYDILGELISVKITHIFAAKYFIGFLTGIYFFYYDETKQTFSFIREENYLPFSYVYNFLRFLHIKYQGLKNIKGITGKENISTNKIKNRKNIIVLICVIIILLLTAYYNLKLIFLGSDFLVIEYTLDLKLIFIYEKFVVAICSMLILCCLKLFDFGSLVKDISRVRILRIFGRINMVYFCTIDNFVYLFFSSYDIILYFKYSNILLLTVGLFSMNLLFSFLIVYLYEFPIRKIYKLIRLRGDKGKIRNSLKNFE